MLFCAQTRCDDHFINFTPKRQMMECSRSDFTDGAGSWRWPVLCTKWLWISICSGQSSFKSYLNPAVNLDPNKSISLWNEHTLHNFRICEKNPAAKVKVTTRWTAEGISSQWSNPSDFVQWRPPLANQNCHEQTWQPITLSNRVARNTPDTFGRENGLAKK